MIYTGWLSLLLIEYDLYWQNMTSIGRKWFILAYCYSYWQNMQPIKSVLPFKVQRSATKMVHGLRHLSYEQRLWHLDLTTLRERRIRGDVIETFKIMTGKKCWSKSVFPVLYLWVSVKKTYREAVEATNQSWCPEILIQPACGAGMEQAISRWGGSYVCEPVQEQIGQVLAKIWALKALLYQPIIWQVTSNKFCSAQPIQYTLEDPDARMLESAPLYFSILWLLFTNTVIR